MSTERSAPATGSAPKGAQSLARIRQLLAIVAVCVLFFQLGGRGLNEPDEGRYSEAGREMMASGDYLTPHLNGAPHYTKPPLTYWLIALSLRTFGVNEFAARLPAALAALATLLAVYLIGRRALGEAGALWAVTVLLSSILFLGVARLITTDMLLTCWVTWSVWALWRWSEDPERKWSSTVWFYVCWGLGLLTKGPVAVLLSCFALAGLRWRNPDLRLRQLCWGRGLLLMLAVALPWFIAVTWRDPELWGYFLGRETMGRVLTNVHGRGEAWWYFFPVMAGGMLPWTPLLVAAWGLRRSGSAPQLKLFRMCVVWAGAGLLLFTLSRSKLPTYVLPLMVPLALLLALTLTRLPAVLAAGSLRTTVRMCLVVSLVILLGVAVALLVVALREYELPVSLAVIPLSVVVILGGAMLADLWRGRLLAAARWLAATTLVLALSVLALVPKVEPYLGGKAPLKFIARRVNEADPDQTAAVVVFGKLRYGLLFYLQRTVLWFQPVLEDEDSPPESDTKSGSVIRNAEELKRLFAGPGRVLCVADSRQADEIARSFGLQVLATEGRYAVLEPVGLRSKPAGNENKMP